MVNNKNTPLGGAFLKMNLYYLTLSQIAVKAFGSLTASSARTLRSVETILVCSVVDAGDPETAEIAFAIAAVTVSVAERLDNTLLRETIAASAIVLHAFSGF